MEQNLDTKMVPKTKESEAVLYKEDWLRWALRVQSVGVDTGVER